MRAGTTEAIVAACYIHLTGHSTGHLTGLFEMQLALEVFAPITLPYVPLGFPLQPASVDWLKTQNWKPRDLQRGLNLSTSFSTFHQVYWRDITHDLLHYFGRAHTRFHTAEPKRAHLWYQSTGIMLVTVTYEVATASFDSQLSCLYPDVTESESTEGHFRLFFRWVVEHLPDFLGQLAKSSDRQSVIVDEAPDLSPHWTHGIYVHTASPNHLLSEDQLAKFTPSERPRDFHVADLTLRARCGWETTAISTTHGHEAQIIADLVKIMGYIWEVHFVINERSSERLRGIPYAHDDLRELRELRGRTALLLDSCHITRLTMIERHFHLIKTVMEEWQMAAMREAIDRSIDLVDMMTAQAHQEMVDDKMLQLTVILLVVTLATVVSVTSDSIKFISEHPEHKIIALLELYGPLLVLALCFFVWFKRRTK